MSGYRQGLAFAALGTTVFSFTLPMVKIALHSFDPWTITSARMLIAGLTAVMVVRLRGLALPDRQLWRSIVVTGLGISVGFPIFSTLAMQRTTSAHGAVIIASLPLLTAVFGVVSHHERVSALFWVGAIAGVTALAIYAWSHGGSEGGDPVADVLLVLAVLSSATGYSEGAKLTRLMPGWHVVSWCVIFLLPLSLVGTVTSVALTQSNYSVTLPPVLALLFVSFGSMYLGFFAWYRGLAQLGITRGSQVQMLQPLLTIMWSALIIREAVAGQTVLTAAFVLACVLATQRARHTQVAPSTTTR